MDLSNAGVNFTDTNFLTLAGLKSMIPSGVFNIFTLWINVRYCVIDCVISKRNFGKYPISFINSCVALDRSRK